MPTNQKALVILISQSGETADTLAALRLAKEEGIMTLAFVNVVGSLCCYNKGIQRTVGSNVLSDRSVCKGQRKIIEEQYSYYISELLTIPEKMQKTATSIPRSTLRVS